MALAEVALTLALDRAIDELLAHLGRSPRGPVLDEKVTALARAYRDARPIVVDLGAHPPGAYRLVQDPDGEVYLEPA